MREQVQSTCYMCGKVVKGVRPVEICGTCGDEMRRNEEKNKAREASHQQRYDRAEFEIVEDMIHVDAGGFSPGAKITGQEMRQMLAMKTLAKGTTVKYLPTGQIYHVNYDMVAETLPK